MGTATKLIADDRRAVSYRPRFAKLTGSVLSAILLQQLIFRWDTGGEKTFYKFKEPCQNKDYHQGDSWCEELGFSRYEFDGALKLIGTKVVKGISKNMAMQWPLARAADFPADDDGFIAAMETSIKHLVIYWTDSNRRTWYWINAEMLDKVAEQLYLDKSDLSLYLGKVGRPLYLLSEMTRDEHKEKKDSPQTAPAAASAPPLSVQVFSQVKTQVPEAPKGFVWVYSTDSTSQYAHLTTGSMTAPVLCKHKLMHRSWYKPAQTYNQREPCPECLRIAAEPKPAKVKQPPQFGDVLIAIARHYFRATDDPLLEVTRGRAGKVAKALLRNFPDATPDQVRDSAAAWSGEHLPLGEDTLPDYFRKWKQEHTNGNRPTPAEHRQPTQADWAAASKRANERAVAAANRVRAEALRKGPSR